jgi:hypothetical protein
MPADLGPVFYRDLRPRRPLYLSGVDHKELRRLEAAGHDVGLLAQPASHGPAAVARYRTWGLGLRLLLGWGPLRPLRVGPLAGQLRGPRLALG